MAIQGPQRVGDPQPHLQGGSGGPQKKGDPQPHLNSPYNNSSSSTSGPQKPGDPQPHLNSSCSSNNSCSSNKSSSSSGTDNDFIAMLMQMLQQMNSNGQNGPQKEGDPQPHLLSTYA